MPPPATDSASEKTKRAWEILDHLASETYRIDPKISNIYESKPVSSEEEAKAETIADAFLRRLIASDDEGPATVVHFAQYVAYIGPTLTPSVWPALSSRLSGCRGLLGTIQKEIRSAVHEVITYLYWKKMPSRDLHFAFHLRFKLTNGIHNPTLYGEFLGLLYRNGLLVPEDLVSCIEDFTRGIYEMGVLRNITTLKTLSTKLEDALSVSHPLPKGSLTNSVHKLVRCFPMIFRMQQPALNHALSDLLEILRILGPNTYR